MKKNWIRWIKSHCLPATKHDLNKLKELIIMNNAELVEKLNALEARANKIIGEVQKLLEALANAGNVSPEVESAVARVETVIGTLDDLNPDAPVEPPTP